MSPYGRMWVGPWFNNRLGCFFFKVGALAVLAVGIWTVVDRSYLEILMRNRLYMSAAYTLIAVGAITILLSLFGCLGSLQVSEKIFPLFLNPHLKIRKKCQLAFRWNIECLDFFRSWNYISPMFYSIFSGKEDPATCILYFCSAYVCCIAYWRGPGLRF